MHDYVTKPQDCSKSQPSYSPLFNHFKPLLHNSSTRSIPDHFFPQFAQKPIMAHRHSHPSPLPAPPLNIPSSSSQVRVQLIDTTSKITGVPLAPFLEPPIKGHETLDCPAFAFLVTHESGRRVLFDLGVRKDVRKPCSLKLLLLLKLLFRMYCFHQQTVPDSVFGCYEAYMRNLLTMRSSSGRTWRRKLRTV
jgi:hypothetical protein